MNTRFQNCPEIGTWRAWIDHEYVTAHRFAGAQGDGPSGRPAEGPRREDHDGLMAAHLSGCPACQRMVAELREDITDVAEVFSILAPARLPDAAEVALARERLERRRDQAPRVVAGQPVRALERKPLVFASFSTPWRVAASGLAAAVALALLVAFTPQGGSVAAAFLAQFRSQQVAAVGVTPQSQADIVRTLNSLGNLGTITAPGVSSASGPEAAARAAEARTTVVSLAEAARTLRFPLLTPDPAALPAGVDKTPQVRVMPGSEIRFTFDKKKAQAYFQSTGHAEISLPDKFDGASLVVSIPAAAVLEYGSGAASKNGLLIAEAGEVVADAQGNVTLPEMRDFLLSLPGLPATVVAQLRQIQNWNDTLPIPVPVDRVQWQSTMVNGSQGLLLNDNSGVVSAVIWHANGHLYGAAGTIKADDLKRVVSSLH
jgi:hypothetical protein